MVVTISKERFVAGDFPNICCRSGLPATKLVPVEARRNSLLPWFFFPGFIFAVLHLLGASVGGNVWGKLPFAEGYVRDVTAEVEAGIGVILRGVHPSFAEALNEARHTS